jgi:hypothetical protein
VHYDSVHGQRRNVGDLIPDAYAGPVLELEAFKAPRPPTPSRCPKHADPLAVPQNQDL